MRKKKNPFLTFCFACIPGAGQMFLGFFKQGVSLMSTFIVVALLSGMFYDIPVYLFDFVIWFYAFFDAINKNAMTEEEFAAQEDKFMFADGLAGQFHEQKAHGKGRRRELDDVRRRGQVQRKGLCPVHPRHPVRGCGR